MGSTALTVAGGATYIFNRRPSPTERGEEAAGERGGGERGSQREKRSSGRQERRDYAPPAPRPRPEPRPTWASAADVLDAWRPSGLLRPPSCVVDLVAADLAVLAAGMARPAREWRGVGASASTFRDAGHWREGGGGGGRGRCTSCPAPPGQLTARCQGDE